MTDQPKNYAGAAGEASKQPTNTQPAPTKMGDEPNFTQPDVGEEHPFASADRAAASTTSLIEEEIEPAMLDEYNSAKFYSSLTADAGITPSKIEPLARSAFGRYRKEANNTAHDGSPIRDWSDMQAIQRNGWRAVVVDLLQNIGYIRG
jgi:hypothetical protein